MFGNSRKDSSPRNTSSGGDNAGSINLIGQGTTIKGTIETEGDLRIEGHFEGTLHSKAKVVLGETARVEGDLTCQNADISGKLSGTLRVSGTCQLKSKSNVEAELTTQKLVVEDGAVFNGRCEMHTSGAEANGPARMKAPADAKQAKVGNSAS